MASSALWVHGFMAELTTTQPLNQIQSFSVQVLWQNNDIINKFHGNYCILHIY